MIIIHGEEEILSYDSSNTNVKTAFERNYRIVVLDNSMVNADDGATIEIGIYKDTSIQKMNTQFVRNDGLDVVRINGNIVFPTIRGFKHISKIGKNDLVKTIDGGMAMCKKQEPYENDDQWYYIKSNRPAIICIRGIFIEV